MPGDTTKHSRNPEYQAEKQDYAKFAAHMKRYVGETVTVFVKCGGPSSAGFCGVLLSVNDEYLRLITRIGHKRQIPGFPGSIANIPSDKVAAFSHWSSPPTAGI